MLLLSEVILLSRFMLQAMQEFPDRWLSRPTLARQIFAPRVGGVGGGGGRRAEYDDPEN
jgi:hypothetical protein